MQSIPFRPSERPTQEWTTATLAAPGNWVGLHGAWLETAPSGQAVRYDLDVKSWTDPLLQQDGRGRGLVEAFSAIPLTTGSGEDLVPEWTSLESFLMTFGPVLEGGTELASMVQTWHTPLRRDDVVDSAKNLAMQVRSLRAVIVTADELARGIGDSTRGDLAEFITWRLGSLRVLAVAGADDRFGLALELNSLLDAMYWQLLQQIMRRPARDHDRPDPVFRLPWCGVCGGVILSTRLADDQVNRWHPGCKAAGQARARRGRRQKP